MVGCLSTDLGAKVPRKQQSYLWFRFGGRALTLGSPRPQLPRQIPALSPDPTEQLSLRFLTLDFPLAWDLNSCFSFSSLVCVMYTQGMENKQWREVGATPFPT